MRTEITIRLFLVAILSGAFSTPAAAQTAKEPPPPKAPFHRKVHPVTRVRPVIVQNSSTAPQVVTILHGLNGLKIFRLLLRSNELAAIAKLDQAFQIQNEVHTNVIAGLALDDGRTIAVWLPQAEAEMKLPAFTYAPAPPAPPAMNDMPTTKGVPPTAMVPRAPMTLGELPSMPFARNLLEPADLKVVTPDGKRLVAQYLGLDGLTGLSVITLSHKSLPQVVESKDENIKVGQRLRLIGPEPAAESSSNPKTPMYVRIGETEASVVTVNRSSGGGLRRFRIKSNRLSPANMGGIAINDAGQTLGIVDAVDGNEATIVPLAMVRSAAKRVIERQASVPRPWLGVRGEPIGALSYERILRTGWQAEKARALAHKRQGIMLTSVVPGSPAARAHLRPGDVILTVNNGEVKNAEDFTWLLDGAGPGSSLKFTVARPDKQFSEAMEIMLSESPDPFFGLRMFGGSAAKGFAPGSLMARGIETIALRPEAAVHFGSGGGLLVVFVEPETAAFKAGLQSGDVIEAINGHNVVSRPVPATLLNSAGPTSTFNVVRNKQKITITIQTK